ncbi:MAG TPA: ATP-binding protein [Tepidisphaeraceae bacterium]|jgi:signal transduction histidine kinase|nr:ATP-binding protein [Tepidisphaeraceae bacterium]
MIHLSTWSLRTKLYLYLGGLLFILVVVSAVSAVVLTHFSQELQRLLRENYDSEVYCDQMIDALDRLDASARQLAWKEAGDPIDSHAQQKRFGENLDHQLHNVSLPGELEETRRLVTDWQNYGRSYAVMTLAKPAERQRLYVRGLLPMYRDARVHAQRIATLNMQNMISADGRVRRRMLDVRNVLLLLVGIGALLAFVVLGAAGATVLQPLRELTRSAKQIGAGDLDLTVPVRAQDELGELADAFNAMAERLRDYRKIDHERLLRAQGTTQLAIDSLPDAVLVTRTQGNIEIANRTAAAHFHAEPGRNVADLGFDWLIALHRQASRGENDEPRGYGSAVQLFDDGHERFFLPRGMPMLDGARVVGVVIILVDVTRLRQADELKSSLVSTVSHELRTPLTSIRMSTLMLAEETLGPLLPRQRKLVEAARDETERLYRIIENLLDFSRAQIGSAKLSFQKVAVASLIADALAPLAMGFEEKEITVDVQIGADVSAWADRILAASVLTNLLSNALKFTPGQGKVRIDAEPCGGRIAISVSDTGPGIPLEHADQLFKRFFRVPGVDRTPGTGLGLAIARQIVEAHEGTLTYAPRPGGGSIFRLTLPSHDSD